MHHLNVQVAEFKRVERPDPLVFPPNQAHVGSSGFQSYPVAFVVPAEFVVAVAVLVMKRAEPC